MRRRALAIAPKGQYACAVALLPKGNTRNRGARRKRAPVLTLRAEEYAQIRYCMRSEFEIPGAKRRNKPLSSVCEDAIFTIVPAFD